MLFISGMVNAPVVATLATALPLMVPSMPLANTATLAGPPGEPPLSACAEYKTVYGFTDEPKNFTVSARTMEICEELRPTYLKQATDPAKVTACKERP